MLTIISPYPNDKSSDGYFYRISTLDEVFKVHERLYLHITEDPKLWGYRFEGDKGIHYLGLGQKNEKHRKITQSILKHSSLIYIHSLYHAEAVQEYLKDMALQGKILLDLHGLVPEELEMDGKKDEAVRFQKLEKQLSELPATWVMMSRGMERYIRGKYPQAKFNTFLLPIFPRKSFTAKPEGAGWLQWKGTGSDAKSVVYAGGVQKWQNVEKMVEGVRKLSEQFRFTFLTPDVDEMQKQIQMNSHGELLNACVMRVLPSEVSSYFRPATYGFILREDHPVNAAACPGKLLEYLLTGVIPVVLQPKIGDFEEYGYHYILFKDLLEGKLIPDSEREAVLKSNETVARKIRNDSTEGVQKLKAFIDEKIVPPAKFPAELTREIRGMAGSLNGYAALRRAVSQVSRPIKSMMGMRR